MSRRELPQSIENLAAASGAAAGEHVWLDVIHKMDEVYHDLLEYEVALEKKNSALEDSQQFISSVLSSMSDVLIVCNRAGVIEEVNPSLIALTGRDEAALVGASIFDLFADEASRRQVQHHFVGQAEQTLHDCEMNLCGAQGAAVPVSLNCTPRFSSVGKLQGLVITGRPIGELRRAYKSLRQAHEDLQRTQQQLLHAEKMASLGRLVAGVAHELNNPISFVLGNVVALKRYAERLRQYCSAVHESQGAPDLERMRRELRIDRVLEDLPSLIEGTVEGAERTRDIVDGLKRFSAADRGDLAPMDLVPVIERAVHWVANGRRERFEVSLDLAPRLPVMGSAGQLQQVLMNLAQNAADATAQRPGPHLWVIGRVEGESAVVELRDSGPGIPPADLGRIFEPFFTTKPVGHGTGLGLAISYSIVERHGGTLAAANAPAGGAVFTLRLPRAPAD
jgi:two-component system sensor histidine kinase HupT/HoxJ